MTIRRAMILDALPSIIKPMDPSFITCIWQFIIIMFTRIQMQFKPNGVLILQYDIDRVFAFQVAPQCRVNVVVLSSRQHQRGMGLTYRVPGVRGHLARILPANRSPQDGGLTQAWLDRKSKSPLFPGPGEGGRGYKWLVHNPSMDFKFDLFTEEENHFPTYLFFSKHMFLLLTFSSAILFMTSRATPRLVRNCSKVSMAS